MLCLRQRNITRIEARQDAQTIFVQLASEKSASWPDVRSAIAARCGMGENDVEKMGAEASSIFVCSIHSNDLRRAIAQVMRPPHGSFVRQCSTHLDRHDHFDYHILRRRSKFLRNVSSDISNIYIERG